MFEWRESEKMNTGKWIKLIMAGIISTTNALVAADPGMTPDILKQISIPTIDISAQTERHVIIAQGTATEWQGHPHTLLMPDGKTIFCVWQGRRDGSGKHGAPVGYLKRSNDGSFVGTTYIKYRPGPEMRSVMSVRFRLDDIESH